MKEVIFKNITGLNPKKREVSLEETSRRFACRMRKKWVSKYYLRETFRADNPVELKKWIEIDSKKSRPNRYHILRRLNERTGVNVVVFKMIGEFYIADRTIAYKIFYVNKLSIQLLG